MNPSLSHIVSWAHRLLGESLRVGDCAIDLTAGNGYDTLMLAQAVGPRGCVLAFDLQRQAIVNSAERLLQRGILVNHLDQPVSTLPSGVSLVEACHAELVNWNSLSPRVIIANLGYLPGGDKDLVTRPDSTLTALQAGCKLLSSGGRIAVVVYPGHAGGRCEADAVDQFFSELDEQQFEVLRLQVANRPRSPFLLMAGKFN